MILPCTFSLKLIIQIPSYRFYIGTMFESKEFQLLSGIMVDEQIIFWPIYLDIIFFTSGLSFIAIVFKMIQERLKEFKIKQNVQINLKKKDQDGTVKRHWPSISQVTSTLQFNNVKHNLAILSGPQIAVISLLILALFTIFHFEPTSFIVDYISTTKFIVRIDVFIVE